MNCPVLVCSKFLSFCSQNTHSDFAFVSDFVRWIDNSAGKFLAVRL